MTNKQPTLGFICPQCKHGMRSVCDSCEEEAAQEAGQAAMCEQEFRREHLAELRKIAGYSVLEEALHQTFGFAVFIEVLPELDEDGATGKYAAWITPAPWMPAHSGPQPTPEEAISALWKETVKQMREKADYLEALISVEEEARG